MSERVSKVEWDLQISLSDYDRRKSARLWAAQSSIPTGEDREPSNLKYKLVPICVQSSQQCGKSLTDEVIEKFFISLKIRATLAILKLNRGIALNGGEAQAAAYMAGVPHSWIVDPTNHLKVLFKSDVPYSVYWVDGRVKVYW